MHSPLNVPPRRLIYSQDALRLLYAFGQLFFHFLAGSVSHSLVPLRFRLGISFKKWESYNGRRNIVSENFNGRARRALAIQLYRVLLYGTHSARERNWKAHKPAKCVPGEPMRYGYPRWYRQNLFAVRWDGNGFALQRYALFWKRQYTILL